MPRRHPGTPRLLRQLNDRAALELLLSQGPLTRAELGEHTGLSKVTSGQLLARLEERGLVAVSGERPGGRGPNAALYAVVPSCAYVAGLDVLPDRVTASVADITGTIITEVAVDPCENGNPVKTVHNAVRQACDSAGVSLSRLRALVIGTRGVVDPRSGDVRFSFDLPSWHSGVLADLRATLGSSVMIENDVNLAALAEHAYGVARGVDDFVLMWAGVGQGLGVMLGSRLHRGFTGGAGEIGWLPVPGEPLPVDVTDPQSGSFQRLLGTAALTALAKTHGIPLHTLSTPPSVPGDAALPRLDGTVPPSPSPDGAPRMPGKPHNPGRRSPGRRSPGTDGGVPGAGALDDVLWVSGGLDGTLHRPGSSDGGGRGPHDGERGLWDQDGTVRGSRNSDDVPRNPVGRDGAVPSSAGPDGAARGAHGSDGAARGSEGWDGVVRGSEGPGGAVRGSRGTDGVVRGPVGRDGAAGGYVGPDRALRGSEGPGGAARGSEGSDGVVRDRAGQDGAARGYGGPDGAARGSEGSDGVVRDRAGQDGAARGYGGPDGAARGSRGSDGVVRGSVGRDGVVPSSVRPDGAARGSRGSEGVVRSFAGPGGGVPGPASLNAVVPGLSARIVRAAVEGGYHAFLDELAQRIAVGVASVTVVLDPRLVVLSGDVGRAGGDVLAERVEKAVARICPSRPKVTVTRVNGNPVLRGAVTAALEQAREEVFSSTVDI